MPVVTDTSEPIHHEACKLLYLLAWLKEDATRHQATTNPQSMAQTPEQHRGALFARPQMELTLISLRVLGIRLTGKHWASDAGPQRNSSPRGPRAQRLLVCLAWNLWLGTSSPTSSPRSLSLPAFLALCVFLSSDIKSPAPT